MSQAWVIRSGRYGERDTWALANGVSGGGWQEVPDLTRCQTREDVGAVVATTFSDASDGTLANYTGQLWALRGRIQVGDLLVMPLKTTKRIAMGRVTGGYEYLAGQPDPSCRHVVRVDWSVTDLPRTAIKQDLLYTLGSVLSVFAPSKNSAVQRLERAFETGEDPGQIPFMTHKPVGDGPQKRSLGDDDDVDEPELQVDIDEIALNQITAKIAEEFAGHGLAALVGEIMEADGFSCIVSPEGPDGGIDIIAGRGVLGLDQPRIIAQVKSGGQVGDPVVHQLHGVMSTQGAEQGLLVAWGGLSKPARDSLKGHQLKIRVWEAADIVQAVLRSYDRLSEDTRSRLPLKRVWMLAD
ncbi:restriction endonuclease [Salinibacterium sp. SYSU T00001]|uniref:restriction endonuclease n=1 Tax=Homoserinimonas sedimenticola TaxID=2986805 RepID=UPI0022355B08|nr:restriction endonuclease [Salinibacterium sedimenticola]MCW4386329.1 restriction endonuclease [Salinibacterium sedimenticola]